MTYGIGYSRSWVSAAIMCRAAAVVRPPRQAIGLRTRLLGYDESRRSCATGFVKSLSVQYAVCAMGFHAVNRLPTLISRSALTACLYDGLKGFSG